MVYDTLTCNKHDAKLLVMRVSQISAGGRVYTQRIIWIQWGLFAIL